MIVQSENLYMHCCTPVVYTKLYMSRTEIINGFCRQTFIHTKVIRLVTLAFGSNDSGIRYEFRMSKIYTYCLFTKLIDF